LELRLLLDPDLGPAANKASDDDMISLRQIPDLVERQTY
jgi:hypothetical protein